MPSSNNQAHRQIKQKVCCSITVYATASPSANCDPWRPRGVHLPDFVADGRTDLKRVNAFLMAPFIIENCFAAPYPLESPKFGQNHERE